MWTHRILLESTSSLNNAWVTLTYDDDHLPNNGNLSVSDFTLFLKRLRQQHKDRKIRFYGIGEYGESCALCGKNKIQCYRDKSHNWVPYIGRPRS